MWPNQSHQIPQVTYRSVESGKFISAKQALYEQSLIALIVAAVTAIVVIIILEWNDIP